MLNGEITSLIRQANADDACIGLITWMRAAAAVADGRGMKVARFGDNLAKGL